MVKNRLGCSVREMGGVIGLTLIPEKGAHVCDQCRKRAKRRLAGAQCSIRTCGRRADWLEGENVEPQDIDAQMGRPTRSS